MIYKEILHKLEKEKFEGYAVTPNYIEVYDKIVQPISETPDTRYQLMFEIERLKLKKITR